MIISSNSSVKEFLKCQRQIFIFHLLVCVCVRCCVVDGGWSRWSPWSRCDKRCGGGRSIRTRSCSSPPPKNGGKKCAGEKNQVKPCNTKPCGESDLPCPVFGSSLFQHVAVYLQECVCVPVVLWLRHILCRCLQHHGKTRELLFVYCQMIEGAHQAKSL